MRHTQTVTFWCSNASICSFSGYISHSVQLISAKKVFLHMHKAWSILIESLIQEVIYTYDSIHVSTQMLGFILSVIYRIILAGKNSMFTFFASAVRSSHKSIFARTGVSTLVILAYFVIATYVCLTLINVHTFLSRVRCLNFCWIILYLCVHQKANSYRFVLNSWLQNMLMCSEPDLEISQCAAQIWGLGG